MLEGHVSNQSVGLLLDGESHMDDGDADGWLAWGWKEWRVFALSRVSIIINSI